MSTAALPLHHYRSSYRPEVLADIREPGVNLCLWHRQPRPAIASLLERMAMSPAPLRLDLTLRDEDSLPQFGARIAALNPYDGDFGLPLLLEDMARLVELFRDVSRSSRVRLRLDRVTDDACAVFHADALPLRMLCSYRGPGAQWLENENVRREELGLRDRSRAAANEAIVIDPAAIRTIPTWHVAVFKGRGWLGEEDNALIHRSHPVCCSEHTRIRLCLDLA